MAVNKELTSSSVESKKKKSPAREWFDSILFAVVAATLIRWLFFEAFTIPTPSMENSLLVGDFLFVSKLHYGTRTPKTPLQVPLTHQTIWGTNIPSYTSLIQLPQYRLPGFSEVKRGDVVVFNYPPELQHPVDLKTNYIKRCVGIPGDKVEVRDLQVYANGQAMENPPRMENEYFVATTTAVNEEKVFRDNGISEFNSFTDGENDTIKGNEQMGYLVFTTTEIAAKLKTYDFVKSITLVKTDNGITEPMLYPNSSLFKWNRDNYGPITVPKEGMTVQLTPENVAMYGPVIKNYEDNEDVVVEEKSVKIGGKAITSYTFKQDYYFMMGDNRHNSADSRYWGFVPMDHIVGKAVFVWMSIDPNPTSFFNKIRWSRIFRVIN
ncbi:signal peptidase I [Dyadobacter sp. BE34]|uniref:Signal peptidase I n=1 Tax=Dyadobacter fermentans TaxID=94254 RepID=A0ABU1QYF4_9BACT|nr:MULTISPECIES: signal peptidase I [Dyadobacter]MDR6806182.1 signal peptidase I [Dyadobacter fermentans]MDR7043923.1 signal peptidase I [Dyadobacter sp. BE242]MDR7198234.1 signal peptidase I [Dyadobacter sp. BE34]MDR7216197.1 signal peptidase I [Dyadobacter sp. BE31]MDR7264277.1 signal peptidase I [Dyadobacter sp. BE32]